jgi:hypothetical protein
MRMHVLGLALLVACSSPAKKEPPPPPPAPVALAIVFNGQEIWVGNETHETDPSVQYKGALRDLVVAFDRLKAPADANGLVVSYADGVHLHRPLGPLREITGSTFGVQRDYRSRIGSDLVDGIEVAAEMLPRGMRGVIVVIGDGNDSHNETATMRLLVLRRTLAKRGVAVHALVIPSALSPDGDVIGVLTPNLRRIKSTAIATELQAIVQTELTSPRGASH